MLGGSRCGLVLSAGLVLAAAGCQGDYPIAPTECDRWCDVTMDVGCPGPTPTSSDPAECVVQCERAGLSKPECSEPLAAALDCFRNLPPNERGCTAQIPCWTEQQPLLGCIHPTATNDSKLKTPPPRPSSEW